MVKILNRKIIWEENIPPVSEEQTNRFFKTVGVLNHNRSKLRLLHSQIRLRRKHQQSPPPKTIVHYRAFSDSAQMGTEFHSRGINAHPHNHLGQPTTTPHRIL